MLVEWKYRTVINTVKIVNRYSGQRIQKKAQVDEDSGER